jgi:hypothetical protein
MNSQSPSSHSAWFHLLEGGLKENQQNLEFKEHIINMITCRATPSPPLVPPAPDY